MTNRLHILLLAAVSLLLAAVSAACSDTQREEPVPAPPGTLYKAAFELSVGEVGSRSRTPDGSYDPGSGIENYIDLTSNDRLRVVLYDLAGNLQGEVTDFTITPLESYDSSKRYYLEGTTDVDISSGKFKVMVLANWPSYPSDLRLSTVWEQAFDFTPGIPTVDKPIPLYGIKDVQINPILPGVVTNLGTIHLLRALAKIEVIFDDSTDYWHISKLELTDYNTRGFCAPAVASQSEYVKDNWGLDYVGRPFIPAVTNRGTDIPFEKIDDRHYMLYVPEYYNTRNDTPEARIRVDFAESPLGERYISFKDPVYNTTTDLMRNIWYKITIKKKAENSDVTFEVDVLPYTVCELDPIFGITKPTTTAK